MVPKNSKHRHLARRIILPEQNKRAVLPMLEVNRLILLGEIPICKRLQITAEIAALPSYRKGTGIKRASDRAITCQLQDA
jgi:hypothetical protein